MSPVGEIVGALDCRPTPAQAGAMTILETVTEHRCEALTISDIPPYRCTTSATADRRGRAVCASHARAPRVRWFDESSGSFPGIVPR
jgi:hypothetical protein